MGKKHCAIVLAATGNMTFALANVLIGLKKHSPNLADDIIVYERGISDKDKQVIQQILPVKFIEYNFSLKPDTNQKYINKFTPLAFARYECFNMLNEYENVLWLDIDISIRKDISSILNLAQKTGISLFLEVWNKIDSNFTQKIKDYDMNANAYNSGILVLNDKLPRYKEMKKWCYNKTENLKDILKTADQGILCLMLSEFHLEVMPLPEAYNYHPIHAESADAFIQHPYGCEKFWNFYDDNQEWAENYNQWLALGGTQGKIWKLTPAQKMIYQKTRWDNDLWDDKVFIDYIIRVNGLEEANKAYSTLVNLVLNGKIKLRDRALELMIKKKYAGLRKR